MSAEYESVSTDHDRQTEPRRDDREPARAGKPDTDAETSVARQETVVTAERDDRGGPPVESPSPVHRTVAARESLWQTYRGSDADGAYVWIQTETGDPGGPEKQL